MGNNIPPIAEKVKFWEEQDKINQAVIPRIIEINDSLKNLAKQLGEVDKKIAVSESRIQNKTKEDLVKINGDLNTSIVNLESNMKSLNESTSIYEKKLNILELELTTRLNSILFPKKYKIIIFIAFMFALASLLIAIIT